MGKEIYTLKVRLPSLSLVDKPEVINKDLADRITNLSKDLTLKSNVFVHKNSLVDGSIVMGSTDCRKGEKLNKTIDLLMNNELAWLYIFFNKGDELTSVNYNNWVLRDNERCLMIDYLEQRIDCNYESDNYKKGVLQPKKCASLNDYYKNQILDYLRLEGMATCQLDNWVLQVSELLKPVDPSNVHSFTMTLDGGLLKKEE
jgi:hypothetical protein